MKRLFLMMLLAMNATAKPVPEETPLTGGAPIALKDWTCRKRIEVKTDGVQQLDLDLETLAHAADDGRDLRVVREGQQFPYVVERPAEARSYVPVVDTVMDSKRQTVSVWKIRLPADGAPVLRVVCQTRATLFDRPVAVYEQTEEGRRLLGSARWVGKPDEASHPLVLAVANRPTTGTVTLELENGDNPGIALEDFRLEYATVRLLFRAPVWPETFLYYGNRGASAPSYDLALVAAQLRAATQQPATLGAEERLRAGTAKEASPFAWVFWIVLAGVVAVLVGVMVKLLPKTPSSN